MKLRKKEICVIGHKNPDTDSICSAIAYAELKNRTEDGLFIPRRAGHVSEETEFVLNYFGVQTPEYLRDVGTEVKEIEIHEISPGHSDMTVRKAWESMKEQKVVTLPVTDSEQQLAGLITMSDIAESYMDIYESDILSQARTTIGSIAETLDGMILTGRKEDVFDKGRVVVGAFNPDLMRKRLQENDLVIMGNRPEDMLCAIELKVRGLVIGLNAEISELIVHLAEEQGCVIISTPHDTITTARLINQAIPVRHLMRKSDLVLFHINDKLKEVRETMTNYRHRDFPVLDRDDRYIGTISRRNLIGSRGKQLILVDHNERSQAVAHIEEAEILEIIDHHRLGSLETMNPILFRNEPVGCTATIIYTIYLEKAVEITPEIAGLLCSAILSDTLMFRSPTCTDRDRIAAQNLARIAGIDDIEAYAKQMFRAGSDLKGKTPQEILYQDFKRFNADKVSFGVGQVSSMDEEELAELSEKLSENLEQCLAEQKIDMLFFMLTNIPERSTELLFCGKGAGKLLEIMTGHKVEDRSIVMRGVVSRKKQLIPEIMSALHNYGG
ncbi:MAG: putative manganese-dependent inorganic diphosphatase [Eubacterium sp.]|nr:putative manganese-dependent inorganic diphosphatase [Eubacterium sp.]